MMSKEKRRVPKLRFPGFTEDWEQRKLSELATMNARIGWQNLRTSEFLDSGDYLLITGTDFDNGRIKYNTCHYVEKKRFDQDTKIQLSTGSILITKDGTLGKVALIEELPKPATLNAGVFNVRVKDDAVLSYKYLYHYLKAPFLMKYVTANATGGTIKHLNQSILVDFPIPITEKQEQDRIAKLLDSLESIITLHQRKLDNLKLKKKALLQKLFPRNGERYPELRFPGFTDAWEQRKFSDLYKKISEKNDLSYSLDKIISVANMYYKSDAKVSNEEYLKTYNIFRYGEIAFEGNKSKDFTYGRFVENTIGDGIISHVFEVFRPITKYDIYFWKYYINYEPIMGKVLSRCTKKTTMMTNLVAKDFLKETVFVPSLAEQKRIGILLNTLDKSITLHQRKLEHLQIQKKSLLQKLFV